MDAAPTSLPVGETAAVVASTLWAAGSLLFAAATRRAGPWGINQFRLFGATAVLALAWAGAGLLRGFDAAPPSRQIVLLVISGVVGLALGDAALFRAWQILGARRVALLGALAPVFVAILAVPVLGDRIGVAGTAGMAVTLAGILWVVADRPADAETRGTLAEGLTMAVLASLGQACGAVLQRAGLGLAAPDSPLGAFAAGGAEAVRPVAPLTAVVVRMSVGAAALAIYTVPTGKVRDLVPLVRDRRTFALAACASFMGTVCGVWLSLVAFANVQPAIAQTLLSLTPVLVLPMARAFTPERPPPRAWIGAAVAVAGAAILAFRDRLGD